MIKKEKVTIYDDRERPPNLFNVPNLKLVTKPDEIALDPREQPILILSRSTIKNRATNFLPQQIAQDQKRIRLAVESLNPGSKVIFLSSGGAIYGQNEDGEKSREIDPINPVTAYGKSKQILEMYVSDICKAYSLNLVIVRPGNPIGKSHLKYKLQNVADIYLSNLLSGQKLEIWGSLEIEKDFFDIRDLAIAIYRLGTDRRITGIYNVGSGVGTSLHGLINTISLVTKKDFELEIHNPIATDISRYALSIDKISNDLDWQPAFSLVDTISKLHKDMMQ